jgi:putative SOS response-associated peptidase YedK
VDPLIATGAPLQIGRCLLSHALSSAGAFEHVSVSNRGPDLQQRVVLRGQRTCQTPLGISDADVPPFSPRYNIAPTQQVLAIRLRDGKRQASMLHWGLTPSWADDPAIGNRMINARADSVAIKPSFWSAFKKSRCLVVADGFYEWQKTDDGAKQPYCIRRKDNGPFAIAGLAEHRHRGDQIIDSCALITTDANDLMSNIHDRMPVILSPADYDTWLDPEFQDKESLTALLRPYPACDLMAYPREVSLNARHTWISIHHVPHL